MTDAVVIPASALPPGDADYAARMIARVDGPVVAPVVEAPVVIAPTPLLAGKYKTQAELEKGYIELLKMKSAPAKPVASPVVTKPAAVVPVAAPVVAAVVDPNAPAVVAPVAVDPAVAAAETLVAGAGLDFTTMSAEYATKGGLSDETFAALEAGGIPRVMVDQYIAGQQAIADRGRTEIVAIAGGEDGYGKLMTWAATALDAPAIAAYNEAVNGSDMDATRLAVTGLKARMSESEGIEPALIEGGASSADGYANSGELRAAMKDPRYNDPGSVGAAYRKSVENKLAVSTY